MYTNNEQWVALKNRNYWWKLRFGVEATMDPDQALLKLYPLDTNVDEFGFNSIQNAFMVFRYEWLTTPTHSDQEKADEFLAKRGVDSPA